MNPAHRDIEDAFSTQLKQHIVATEGVMTAGEEQMRYEAAKAFMAAMLATGTKLSPEYLAQQAFEHADALIESFRQTTN